MKRDVFGFNTSREILVNILEEKKNKNPRFSLRSWSRQLGFRNPSYLSDVLNGKVRIKPKFALKIGEIQPWQEQERVYFETLAYLENAKSSTEQRYYRSIISQIKVSKFKSIPVEKHPYENDWRSLILDEIPCVKDFTLDYRYISKRLRVEMSPQAVELVLSDLIAQGFLKKNKSNEISRGEGITFMTKRDDNQPEPPSFAVSKKACMEMAMAEIDKQLWKNSHFKTLSVPLKKKKIPIIKELLDELIKKTMEMGDVRGADEVYLLNLAFFSATGPAK